MQDCVTTPPNDDAVVGAEKAVATDEDNSSGPATSGDEAEFQEGGYGWYVKLCLACYTPSRNLPG